MKRAIALTAFLTGDLNSYAMDSDNSSIKRLLVRFFIAIRPVFYGLLGFVTLVGNWDIISQITDGRIPSPVATFPVFWELIKDPFYYNGPNDNGIAIQLFSSLIRVFSGFLLGSLIAIPAGLLLGASETLRKTFYPVVQILRPVSPLAWFPLGLAALESTSQATIFIIFMTSLWPTLINTSFGVASIPDDHKNVAKVFGFSKWKYLTKILIPFSLPHIITGLRLSIGVAWMVIVAGEMLSGSLGIGGFVWNSYNASSLESVISAILFIGLSGLLLDRGFSMLEKKFAY